MVGAPPLVGSCLRRCARACPSPEADRPSSLLPAACLPTRRPADIHKQIATFERVITGTKNAQQVLRAFRHNTAIRRKVTKTMLAAAIEFYVPAGASRDALLAQAATIPHSEADVATDAAAAKAAAEAVAAEAKAVADAAAAAAKAVEEAAATAAAAKGGDKAAAAAVKQNEKAVEEKAAAAKKEAAAEAKKAKKTKGKKAAAELLPRTAVLPEIELYLRLLVVTSLERAAQYERAAEFAAAALAPSAALNLRTADAFHAKLWSSLSLCYERTGKLQDIRAALLGAHRTACLQHNEIGQAYLLALLLRNFCHYSLYGQALKLVSKTSFPEGVSNNQYLRYLFYLGKISAVQLAYSDANAKLQQCLRKAPVGGAHSPSLLGFRRAVAKLALVVQLLMGTIPERKAFEEPALKAALAPYLVITQALRVGNLQKFGEAMTAHGATLRADGTFTLLSRLRHNVIKTGLRKISTSYSRISFADIAAKLHLESAEEAEPICAKAIADGVIDAVLDHEAGTLQSKESANVYSTAEPQRAFHTRTLFCMEVHNEAVRAMQYPPDAHKKALAVAEKERKEREDEEAATSAEIAEMGDDEMDEDE
jgi:26S proteasome regulatory subunit N3